MVSVYERLVARAYDNAAEYLSAKKNPEQNAIYREEERRVRAEFKKDCLEDLGLAHHPKADLLFQKAWAYGHGSGYEEVWFIMRDWADLLQ
jgi:hypothetical protein